MHFIPLSLSLAIYFKRLIFRRMLLKYPMPMRNALITMLSIGITLNACQPRENGQAAALFVAEGAMPSISTADGIVYLVYGKGDSIMYCSSSDNGKSFSSPIAVGKLPELAASHTRGPQIAVSDHGVIIIACTTAGDIFSYSLNKNANWIGPTKINDKDTIAKENLMSLSADGKSAFAVWLDLRDNNQNKIYGSQSIDGGITWTNNVMIYTSPDTTVCECCKPSVAMKGNNVYVMFRNWLDSSRDMYVIQSIDGGRSFGKAEKLGKGTWKLDGCPMDGGGITISKNGAVQTVWRREGKLFFAEPGKPETEIGKGKGASIASVNGGRLVAWAEDGKIMSLNPSGNKNELGEGSLPIIRTVDDKTAICVWENKKKIYSRIINL
jgi:hypothetical protein